MEFETLLIGSMLRNNEKRDTLLAHNNKCQRKMLAA